jgi:hypothetical protein
MATIAKKALATVGPMIATAAIEFAIEKGIPAAKKAAPAIIKFIKNYR